ncbi:unnamed protein product [Linum trigynum]|uniref:Rho termination factor-like N-terminal domain-containing protein n=1 Tax=Linum trigynum TaxID=586398 RepID=A0AAV2FRE1_9ROSI
MDAAASSSYGGPAIRLPHFSSSKCVRLQKISFYSAPSKGDGSFAFASPKVLGSGNRISSNRMSKKQERKATNSSREKEIIALFRRIRIAISSTESRGSAEDASSQKKRATIHSVSGKAKNKEKVKQEETKRKQGMLEKQVSQSTVQGGIAEFKTNRPPTNFMRRSPIPSTSAPRVMDNELDDGNSATQGDKLENQKLEQMKLAQLKELAKSRGVKGYSKLKKRELVEFLKYSNC